VALLFSCRKRYSCRETTFRLDFGSPDASGAAFSLDSLVHSKEGMKPVVSLKWTFKTGLIFVSTPALNSESGGVEAEETVRASGTLALALRGLNIFFTCVWRINLYGAKSVHIMFELGIDDFALTFCWGNDLLEVPSKAFGCMRA